MTHNRAKNELMSDDSDDSSPVPDMLRLEGNDDGQQSDEDNFSPELRSKEERKDSVSVKGQATVAFTRSG